MFNYQLTYKLHGYICSSVNIHATEGCHISKDAQLSWLSFEISHTSVACTLMELQTFP